MPWWFVLEISKCLGAMPMDNSTYKNKLENHRIKGIYLGLLLLTKRHLIVTKKKVKIIKDTKFYKDELLGLLNSSTFEIIKKIVYIKQPLFFNNNKSKVIQL